MEAPLELVDVRKSYGRVAALRGVGFAAAPGRVCGLLGANGAGKSTALRVLLRLARADSGRALVGGAPFAGVETPACVVGAVLESVGLRPDRSGRDHLRVAARRVGSGLSGSIRCSTWSASRTRRGRRPAATRSGCASGWRSRVRCSATRRRWYWTSRRTGSIHRVGAGWAGCCARWRARAGPCS
jgi:ABC-2 type transport system ATP-binding protein